ncbi:YcgN family cysteine cluster protein [Pseudochelatococcus sp. B33]
MTEPGLPFWKTKKLHELSEREWESLCDGCGRCCLVKLEDEDTGRIYATDVACRLFDAGACRCRDYAHRQALVPDCIRLTPAEVARLTWLPPTCAYRLVREGADLYWWHPLVSGDPETVHAAGVSVRGRVAASEDDVAIDDLPDRIVHWPMLTPEAEAAEAGPSRRRKREKRGRGG